MDTKEMIAPVVEQGGNRLREMQARVGESARQASDVAGRYVHENPWTTIAIAAVVGCMLGFFLRSGRD